MYSLVSSLAENPGSHAAVVLDDGGLERIDEDRVEFLGQGEEHGLIDEEPLGAVTDAVDVAAEALEVHADSGAEAAEEQTAGLQDTP